MNSNVVKTTTSSTGSGNLSISVPSFAYNGYVDYSIYSQSKWERGYGLYKNSILYRHGVYSSSQEGNKISLSGVSDVIFYPTSRNSVYTSGTSVSSGNMVFYNGIFWETRNLSSGDITSALGYIPGTGSGSGSGIGLPIQMSDVVGLEASLSGKQPTGVYLTSPIAISNVTNLQASLDGKQASGSYASSSHTHPVTDIIGLDGSTAFAYDVYNYGVSHTGNALTNTVNFQKLLDDGGFAGKNNAINTCFNIPAQPSTGNDSFINLQWPVFLNYDRMSIKGAPLYSTRLRSVGPAIVFGKHPKYWNVRNVSFDDRFNFSGSVTNGSKNISSISSDYITRIRSGCAISGVGIPSSTLVTGINYGTNTISLSNNATATQTSSLFFYSSSESTSGYTSISSNTISGIALSNWNNISIGSLVSGSIIQSETYVLSKNSSNTGIVITKTPISGGYYPFAVVNRVNNSIIAIKGNTLSGSPIVSGISSSDIKRISLSNTCSLTGISSSIISKVDRANNSITLNTNATSSNTQTDITVQNGWFDLKYYQEDVVDFMAGGLFPPNNGNSALGISTGRNAYKALRTRGGIAQYRFPFHSMATGDDKTFSGAKSTWPDKRTITWEIRVYHHEPALYGGIVGVGSEGYPDPWFLFGGYNGADQYYFDVALTDDTMLDRTAIRLSIPQNSTVGLHRITIQFNADDDVNPFIAWVDGVRKQVKFYVSWAEHKPGYHRVEWYPLISGDNFLFTTPFRSIKFNRLARWEWRELTVGGVYDAPGKGDDIYGGGAYKENDFTVISAACYNKLLYQNGTVGSSQLKASDGLAADDSYAWAYNSGFTNSNYPIGCLTFSSFNTDVNDCDTNIHTVTYSKDRVQNYGYICPRGVGNHGMYEAIANCNITDLYILNSENNALSCGIYQGNFLYGSFNNLKINGYCAAIGSSSSSVCYTAHYSELDLGGILHIINQTAYIKNVNFNYCSYSAMRTAGARVHLHNFMAASPNAFTDGFWTDFSGTALGAGIKMSEGMVNWEDFYLFPSCFFLYTQKRAYHPENYVEINNVTNGTQAVPILYLDDTSPNDSRTSLVKIDYCLTGMSHGIYVRGSDWIGQVNIHPGSYSNTVTKFLLPINGTTGNPPRVKTVDNLSHTLPYGNGGYVSNCHVINPVEVSEGGVSQWVVKNSNQTGVFYEGSSSPPSWKPVSIMNAQSGTCLSANGLSSIRVETSVDWPGQTGVSPIQGGFQLIFAKDILSHIFLGQAATKRGYFNMGYAYNLVNNFGYSNILQDNSFMKASSPLRVYDYFSPAMNGVRENVSGITLTTSSVPAWKVIMTRPFVFSLQVGENGQESAYYGRTAPLPPKYWTFTAGSGIIIPSGGLKLRHMDRSGGWTIYGANKIMDYVLDGSVNANASPSGISLPSTLYVGLSTTEITASGTNITEPTGVDYTRKAISRTSSDWELFGDNYAVRNKNDIVYNTPITYWGNIKSTFISDASGAGNILFKANVNKPYTVSSGSDPVIFKAGSIHIQI